MASPLPFSIDNLDHVALAVTDLEASATWYVETLGLTRIQVKEWGPWPIMLFAGTSGIALFPSKTNSPKNIPSGDYLHARHFAFRLSPEAFIIAQESFHERGIAFRVEDHPPYKSIYLRDPDNYEVELTTLAGVFPGKD